VIGVFLAASAQAQLPFRWFGPKDNPKNPPAKPAADPRRAIEVSVEIAWLADPVVFPYYLEAHVNGTQLEVRGYVPNKSVREHALRIAQVYSSMPVVDAMKEHPSLLVRPGAMSSQQLQAAVLTSLRVALPKQHQQLKVECKPDGTVYVSGPMSSLEEKVVVSHSLRRLHGCTSVQNMTTLPGEIALLPRERMPVVVQQTKGLPLTEEPPLSDRKLSGPVLIPIVNSPGNAPEVVKAELPSTTDKAAPLFDARELQKRIQAACPQVASVTVDLLTKTNVRITVVVRADQDVAPTAERILGMPELRNYRDPALLFRVGSP
jgi:hypothetical protein